MKKEDATIRKYAKGYWETFNDINDYNEECALATFKMVLQAVGKLHETLTMSPAKSLGELLERMQQHAIEEAEILIGLHAGRPRNPTKKVVQAEHKSHEEEEFVPNRR